jgi:metal-responsive CopG/Arc/MetJ family transcriptional regulator
MQDGCLAAGAGSSEREAMTQIAIRFPNEVLEAVDKIVASRPLERIDRSAIIRDLAAWALALHRKRQPV